MVNNLSPHVHTVPGGGGMIRSRELRTQGPRDDRRAPCVAPCVEGELPLLLADTLPPPPLLLLLAAEPLPLPPLC